MGLLSLYYLLYLSTVVPGILVLLVKKLAVPECLHFISPTREQHKNCKYDGLGNSAIGYSDWSYHLPYGPS